MRKHRELLLIKAWRVADAPLEIMMMKIKFVFFFVLVATCVPGFCQDQHSKIAEQISARIGKPVEGVRLIKDPEMWEATVDGRVVYVDPTLSYAFTGALLDLRSKEDRTQLRLREMARIDFENLPLEAAVVQKKGKGRNKVIVFEDPNCKYCKELEKKLDDLEDVTIYTFMLGILTPDSLVLAKNIWCSDDRSHAWTLWMREQKRPAEASCESPNEKVLLLGAKLRIQSTPTMLFSDGSRLVGMQPMPMITKHIAHSR
jgi:thiol:disulfide interchange protein DsbC